METDARIFGAWEDLAAAPAGSHHVMVLQAGDLSRHWRRCSLSADFWARYAALFAPASPPAGGLRRGALEGVLQYMLNELFENCAKFSAGAASPVRYESWSLPEGLVFQLSNQIEARQQPPFEAFIRELLENDPAELYFQRLEKNAESDHAASGLGYLTLIKDYGVGFGFRFSPAAAGDVAVDVQAHVSLKEA